jgi:hypothetical protein
VKIVNPKKLINDFAKRLEEIVENVPDDFYDTFEFTKTDNNYTHPWTWARLIEIFSEIDNVTAVLNDQKNFKPDIVIYNEDFNFSPVLYIDYESPSSSDARIVTKDVDKYIAFNKPIPYVIITTLPKKESPKWKLLWAGKDGYNNHLYSTDKNVRADNQKKIQKNPFDYWYSFYRSKLKDYGDKLENIYFLNINGKQISFEDIR